MLSLLYHFSVRSQSHFTQWNHRFFIRGTSYNENTRVEYLFQWSIRDIWWNEGWNADWYETKISQKRERIPSGKVEGCPRMFNATTEIVDYTIDCFFRTWMLPVSSSTSPLLSFIHLRFSSSFTFSYRQFFLLISSLHSSRENHHQHNFPHFLTFSNTFEQVRDSSMLHYRYKHYQVIHWNQIAMRLLHSEIGRVRNETANSCPIFSSLLYMSTHRQLHFLLLRSTFLVSCLKTESFVNLFPFRLCRRSGKMSVTVDSAVLLKTEPGSPEDECAEIIKLIDMWAVFNLLPFTLCTFSGSRNLKVSTVE